MGKIPWRRDRLPTPVFLGFPYGSAGKESTCNVGDLDLTPGLGRSPGEEKGYPLQYSGLENSMDCIVHGVSKSRIWLIDFHFHFLFKVLPTRNLKGIFGDSTHAGQLTVFQHLTYQEFQLYCVGVRWVLVVKNPWKGQTLSWIAPPSIAAFQQGKTPPISSVIIWDLFHHGYQPCSIWPHIPARFCFWRVYSRSFVFHFNHTTTKLTIQRWGAN